MENHYKISIFKTPKIWFIDKYKTGLNKPGLYFFGILPSIFVIFGLLADVITIINIGPSKINILILIFLFVYGIINLVLVFFLQQNNLRLSRTRNYFGLVHKNIILKFREYITAWDDNPKMQKTEKIKYIKEILTLFNDTFMKDLHRKETVITLKYLEDKRLYPIRVGDNTDNRKSDPEELNESYIYLALNKTQNTMKYIYVKNLENPDKLELLALGQDMKNIQARAINNYSTFIAIPIRSDEIKEVSTIKVCIKKNLGILGFDLKEKYGFGNLEPYELDIIGCLSDLLSVIVDDITKI